MLKTLQIAFLVLAGAAFVLFSIWSHLTGGGTLFVVAIGASLAYVGAIARALLGKDAGVGAYLPRIWRALLGKPVRAALMTGLALGVDVVMVAVLLRPAAPIEVRVTVRPRSPTVRSQEEGQPFRVWIAIPNAADLEPKETHDRVAFTVPPLGDETRIVVRAEHPAFENTARELPLKEARNGVALEPQPRPRLVISVEPEAGASGISAAAWVVGQQRPPERPLSGGGVIFLARRDEDWLVRLVRGNQEHRSAPIPIDREVKAYLVRLSDADSFPWTQLSEAEPTFRRVPLTFAMAKASVGEAIAPAALDRFLYGGPPDDAKLLVRTAYVCSFNPDTKIPNWVAYRLLPPKGRYRRATFRPDPAVRSAVPEDYRGSGYDRGNLVAFSDMAGYGQEASDEAFLMSVAVPQAPAMNRKTWFAIEELGRGFVGPSGAGIWIVAGTVVAPGSRALAIGENDVVVPTHLFRVHTRLVERRPDTLCFLVPNDPGVDPDPWRYVVSLGHLEEVTGLRFFQGLPENRQPDRTQVPKAPWK